MWNILSAFKNLDPMNWETLKPSLNFLWQGLLAIFIVIFAIIIVVKLTSFIITKCEEAKKKKAENQNDEQNPTQQ